MNEAEIKERNEDLLKKFNELVEEKERCCNNATKKETQRIEKLIEKCFEKPKTIHATCGTYERLVVSRLRELLKEISHNKDYTNKEAKE